ncbi:MAG: hypothetical protein M1816_006584 [Peltula sp. TS41687]|nr:MAG: hypothetical protein M1816_006584 [Peltula sp. TS41687]
MSDIEDYFDEDDDYYYWEEDPVDGVAGWADDLAEHTVQSPVWQEGDPDYDSNDSPSDWDYSSDDYYDHDPPPPRKIQADPSSGTDPNKGKTQQLKRKRTDDDATAGTKRRKPAQPGSSQVPPAETQSPIKYRTEISPEQSPTILQAEEGGEKVAILKDWRARFPTDGDEHPGEQDGGGTRAQEAVASVGGRGSHSGGSTRHKALPQSRLPKPRTQERTTRKSRPEVKASTVFMEKKPNGVAQPSGTESKPLLATSKADTLTNTMVLATMPNGHQNQPHSRKRKQADIADQAENNNKVDENSKRQKGGTVSSNKRVTKEGNSVFNTNESSKRMATRSGKGGRK